MSSALMRGNIYIRSVLMKTIYIISRVQRKNGREKEKLIGIYPADRYTIDTELMFSKETKSVCNYSRR